MAAPTEYYVDTVNGDDGNAGTSPGGGNAWQTIKWALEEGIPSIGRDATNGDRVNMHAPVGTPDVYNAGDPAISLSAYGADATSDAPLIVRGVESDGSTPAIAYITCPGRYLLNESVFDFSRWINLSIVGGSATGIFQMDRDTLLIGCLFDNTAGGNGPEIDGVGSLVALCDCQGSDGNNQLLIMLGNNGNVIGCYIHERTNSCRGLLGPMNSIGNIIHLNSTNAAGHGINTSATRTLIQGNTIINDAAGVAAGISCGVTATNSGATVLNNYVEGYSGTGGRAIDATGGTNALIIATNRWFNSETGIDINDVDYSADNSVTSASGLIDAANGDYTPTAELQAIGLPMQFGSQMSFINIGAVQGETGTTGTGGGFINPVERAFAGVFEKTGTAYALFNSLGQQGEPAALSGGAAAVLEDGSDTTVSVPLAANVASTAGLNRLTIGLEDPEFEPGKSYTLLLTAGSVDAVSVAGRVVGSLQVVDPGVLSLQPALFLDLGGVKKQFITPTAGSTNIVFGYSIIDQNNEPADPDSLPIIELVDAEDSDLTFRLSNHSELSVGVFSVTYTATAGDPPTELTFRVSATKTGFTGAEADATISLRNEQVAIDMTQQTPAGSTTGLRLDNMDEAVSTIETGTGGGGTPVSPFIVDEQHTWRFQAPDQLTAINRVYEVVGFDALLAMDFTEVISDEVSIQAVNLVLVEPDTSPGEGIDISYPLLVSPTKKIVHLPTIVWEPGDYVVAVQVTTTDSQLLTRRGVLSIESITGV